MKITDKKIKTSEIIYVILVLTLTICILFFSTRYFLSSMDKKQVEEQNKECSFVKSIYTIDILDRLVEIRDQKQFCQNINCSNYFNNQESELTQQLNIIENATCAI